MDIEYIGEHLLPGTIGKISVLLAFVSALMGCIAYIVTDYQKDLTDKKSWLRFSRFFLATHSMGVLGIIGALFYIIQQHLFEYFYAWQHSSYELPPKYLLSCFWEGQEGSFLLWMFWHAVLSWVLIWRSKLWEAPVMAVVLITQAFLASMLLGFNIGDIKIGSNPFSLLREVMEAPIFSRPDYISFIKDGNGLNPLLQNYWMVIHPPVLFLGFASTLIPFAFTVAALWKKDFNSWVKPLLPWTIFSVAILGTGILMGGAWAYEALSFGGFWAWDPVENASLVPWITLVAGLHTLVIYKSTGYALRASFLFFIATFVLILYSTFLTRSGILGDTSVHAFTDLGMSGQLVFFMAFFTLIALFFLFIHWSKIPEPAKEEQFSSREFWMFIGALVFTISAIQITFTTSIPVWNKFLPLLRELPFLGKIFEKDLAPPVDVIQHYNSVQVWVAILIALGIAITQFLKYKQNQWGALFRILLPSFILALVFTIPVAAHFEILSTHYVLLLFAALFAALANIQYIFLVIKGKWKVSGASVTHVGFALLLLGTLISQHNQRVISINQSGIDFGEAFDEDTKRENVLLRRDIPVQMEGYEITYVGDSVVPPNTYYKVDYKKYNDKQEIVESFRLLPNAQLNKNMGLVSSPDTRHYLSKDIYTHVTSIPDKESIAAEPGTITVDTVLVGDTFYTAKTFVILDKIVKQSELAIPDLRDKDIAIGAQLIARTLEGEEFVAIPKYVIRGNLPEMIMDTIAAIGASFRIERVLPETQQFVISTHEKDFDNDFIIMKAIEFPFINVLWLGCFVMLIGFTISIFRRSQENIQSLKKGGLN